MIVTDVLWPSYLDNKVLRHINTKSIDGQFPLFMDPSELLLFGAFLFYIQLWQLLESNFIELIYFLTNGHFGDPLGIDFLFKISKNSHLHLLSAE